MNDTKELEVSKEIIAKLVDSGNEEFKDFVETAPVRYNKAMLNWLREHGYLPYPIQTLAQMASSGKSETLGEFTKPASLGITGECPKCAYKHLTAAYAAASSGPAILPAFPAEQDVYRARARIALGEALTGYPGNTHLAAGCLAMAEQFTESSEDRLHYRKVRLNLQPGDPFTLRNALLELKQCPPAAYVYAHVSEALRELPELVSHIGLPCTTDTTYLTALKQAIMWLVDLYELAPDDPVQTEKGKQQ